MKKQLRKNHIERMYKSSKRQLQKYLNFTTTKNDADDLCNPYTGSPLDEKENDNL